jgi:hypothetical protein
MKKLTLSMEEKDIRAARRIARAHGTSISGMFTRMVRVMSKVREKPTEEELPPLTRKAMGMIKLPEGRTEREVLEDALLDKHGLDQ